MGLYRLKNAGLVLALLGFAACTDSTGPGSVSSEDALRSLVRGFNSGTGAALPLTLSPTSLGHAGSLGQATVTLDGKQETMYALGFRVTYPAGTCMENLIAFSPSTGFPSGCTPPPFGLMLALWQTTSGSRPPDRMILISAEAGTSSFDRLFDLSTGADVVFPAFAAYIEGNETFLVSIDGTLTSEVTATSQTCAVPPPPFAKTSTCNVALFDEIGRITFEEFSFGLDTPGVVVGRQMELEIPRQTIPGIIHAITEIQPIFLPD